MYKKNKRLLATVAVLACVTPAFAQDLAPPKLDSEASILAWAKNSKIADNTAEPAASWQLLGASDAGLHMTVIAQNKDAAGIAKVGVRLERFKPEGAVPSRSEGAFYDLDCNKALIKATMDAAYANHNLTGAKVDRPVPATWSPVASNDLVDAVREEACKTAAPKLLTIRDAEKWVEANGVSQLNAGAQGRAWNVFRPLPMGVLLTARDDVNETARTLTLHLRLERFEPAPNDKIKSSLSEMIDYEVNCTTKKQRQTAETRYVLRNMGGASEGNVDIKGWKNFSENQFLGKNLDDMCSGFTVKREFQIRAQ